jgi:putative ABC transport system substrate-binding protein
VWRLLLASFLAAFWAVFGTHAQTPDRVARVGVLVPGSMTQDREGYLKAFREELRSRGWEEGRNLVLEFHLASGQADRLPDLAAALVSTNPDAILAMGGAAPARAAQLATKTIPIIMVAAGGDPIEAGLIQSFARPSGNVTGSVIMSPQLNAKRLEFIKEVLPQAKRVAVTWNPTLRGTEAQLDQLRAAAPALAIELTFHEVSRPEDLAQLAASLQRTQADALVVLPDPAVLETHIPDTLALVAQAKLPAIYPWRSYVAAGGLMAYAPSLPDLFRRAAMSLDRILAGASPAELPVEQPTAFELTLNLAAAREAKVDIPAALVTRADEVIE